MSTEKQRQRFERLRAAVLVARDARDAFEAAMHLKYGPGVHPRWLSGPELRQQEKLRAAYERHGDKIAGLVSDVSPRSWERGVPAGWVREELTWEDAIRPLSEPLSAEVPLSYGSGERDRIR